MKFDFTVYGGGDQQQNSEIKDLMEMECDRMIGYFDRNIMRISRRMATKTYLLQCSEDLVNKVIAILRMDANEKESNEMMEQCLHGEFTRQSLILFSINNLNIYDEENLSMIDRILVGKIRETLADQQLPLINAVLDTATKR